MPPPNTLPQRTAPYCHPWSTGGTTESSPAAGTSPTLDLQVTLTLTGLGVVFVAGFAPNAELAPITSSPTAIAATTSHLRFNSTSPVIGVGDDPCLVLVG